VALSILLQDDDGYTMVDTNAAFAIKREPSSYEQPVLRRIRQASPANANLPSDDNYDNISDVETTTTIPIATSHALKLPAEYNKVMSEDSNVQKPPTVYDRVAPDSVSESHDYYNQGTIKQQLDDGYHMLEAGNMSPANNMPMLEPNGHVHVAQKAKTLTPAQSNYETPLDADMKSHIIPAKFSGVLDNYETPLDA
jgi:hypothetical protein